MTNKKLNKIWNYLPLLHVFIEVPFFSVHSCLMMKQIESDNIQYIVLQIRIFKWSFEIGLYDTFRRIRERE